MKLRAAFAALLLGAVAAAPAHAAKYQIKWLLAHNNLDYFREAVESFKKIVETTSKGEIEVTVVTAESDSFDSAGSPEIAAAVAAGQAEMGHSFTDVMGAVEPKFMVFDAPYLFRDYRHMEGVIEGPVGAELLASLRAKNMEGLCLTYSGGASGIATAGRRIRGPQDLKGLKVGVYGHAVNNAWLKSLGATPVPVEHRLHDIAEFESSGAIDAVATTWRNFERYEFYPAFKYVNVMGATYLVSVTYMNKKFFESLPPAYRELIKKASLETARIERAKTIELNANARRAELGRGAESVGLSEEARRAFAAALRPAYKEIERILGKGFVERARRAPDGPAHPEVVIAEHFAAR